VTRRKILAAATQEFSERGVAGARVERITDSAGVNNALLYRYFRSKRDLFEAVYGELVTSTVAAVDLDPSDLVQYVVNLYDYYRQHPEVIRLTIWRELERSGDGSPSAATETQRDNLSRLADAQLAGVITDKFSPSELMEVLLTMSLLGSVVAPTIGTDVDVQRRRAVLAAAVESIINDANRK
jgi:AcrR family transcriptional regulator